MKKQKVIKITEENRDKVAEYLNSKKNDDCSFGFNIGCFYGLDKHNKIVFYICDPQSLDVEVVQNLSDLEEKPAKTFPRMMMVGDREDDLQEGMVFFINSDKKDVLPVMAATGEDLASLNRGGEYELYNWKMAAEMPDPIKITRAQIKEWAGGEFEIVD